MDLDDRPLPKPVQVAECGGPCEQQGVEACDCGYRDAAHQDYSEDYVFDDRANWPGESEICVQRLLAGGRGH